jgi:hypothetical protein
MAVGAAAAGAAVAAAAGAAAVVGCAAGAAPPQAARIIASSDKRPRIFTQRDMMSYLSSQDYLRPGKTTPFRGFAVVRHLLSYSTGDLFCARQNVCAPRKARVRSVVYTIELML